MKVFLQALGEQVWQVVEVGWIKPKEVPVDWDDATIIAANFNSRALNALFCGVTNEEFKKISSTEVVREAWTIHAFIWISCAPLIILNHFYVSRGEAFQLLVPFVNHDKKGGEIMETLWFLFFLRFYMLGGEIHASVRGRCVSSCQGECLPPSSCTPVL